MAAFSIRGRTEIKTLVGSCASLFILSITLIYGLFKLDHLLNRRNPRVAQSVTTVDIDARLDMNSEDTMLAFVATNWSTGEILSDKRYVRFIADS